MFHEHRVNCPHCGIPLIYNLTAPTIPLAERTCLKCRTGFVIENNIAKRLSSKKRPQKSSLNARVRSFPPELRKSSKSCRSYARERRTIAHPLRKHAKTSKAILNSFALSGRTWHLPSGGALSIPSMSDRDAVELLHVSNPARTWDEASMSLNVSLYFVVGWIHGWRQPYETPNRIRNGLKVP